MLAKLLDKPWFMALSIIAIVAPIVFVEFPKGKLVDTQPAGQVQSIEEVPTSWNEPRRTKVVTDNGIFHIRGVVSIMFGVSAELKTYDSGKRYLCLSDREKCSRVIN